MSIRPHRQPESTCQAKVRQLEGVGGTINEQVLGFKVAVQHPVILPRLSEHVREAVTSFSPKKRRTAYLCTWQYAMPLSI